MPLYSIKGPDGNTYQIEGPEGATREQIIDAIQYKLGQQAKPSAKPETTFGGNVKEFFKGLAPGAIGLVESAAVGASALLPKDTEESARKRIAEIAGAAKAPFAAAPGYEETIGRKFGEATGSIGPFLALGPAGIAGRAGMAALGTGAGAGEARTRAEQEGATAEQRGTATALGSVVGLSEMFAPLRILGRLDDPIKRGVTAQLKRIAAAGGEEAAQEAAAQIAQNLIAKGIYKPEQEIIEQVGESAAYGGAVGALAQGLLDMALGRRVKGAGTGTPDEIAQARAEADAAAAAEKERKESPEYAKQFVADYETRRQAFIDARKELTRPDKDATPDVWQAYKEQRDAVTALNDDLKKDAKEYNQLAPKVKEEMRRAEMQPEDVMLEQLGMKVEPVAPLKTRMVVDEFGQVTEVPEGQEAAEPVSAPQQYLTQQVEAARGFGQLGLGDYADFAMQDPKMAAEVVKERVRLPMLSSAENNALLSGISLRLKENEKQRAAETKALYEQRSADLKAQQPTPETTNELAEIEQYLAEIAERGPAQVEPTFEYLDPIFEQAFNQPPTIKISDKVQPIKNAPAVRERIELLMQQADQADQDYRTARAARQPDAAVAARRKGTEALQQIDAFSKEGNEYSKEFLAARKGQNEALAGLQDVVERLRTGQVLGKETFVDEKGQVQRVPSGKGAAASTEQTLLSQGEKFRAQLITNALQEAALHRRAAGESQITQDEAIKAAAKLYETVEALLSRAKTVPQQAEFEEVVVQPAQMRGTKIVKPAVTERREVKPAVTGISPAEIKHFTERINAVQRRLLEKPEVPVTRIAPELKIQFPETEAAKVAEARGETAETVGGALRRRTEFVRDKMAKMGVMRPMARDVLNKAADVMDAGQASKDLLDAVEPVVDAITSKRQVTQTDLRAINDALRAAEPTAREQLEAGQKQLGLLFEEPGKPARRIELDLGYIRMSPENFANSPRMKPVWEALAKAKRLQASKTAKQQKKQAQGRMALAKIEKLEEVVDSIKKDSKFFEQDVLESFSNLEIAKAYVEFPAAGKTPEERALMARVYALAPQLANIKSPTQRAELYKRTFTDADDTQITRIEREHALEVKAHKNKLDSVLSLLAQGTRLDDTDNELVQFMQSTNKGIKDSAANLKKKLAVYTTAIKHLRSVLPQSQLTPQQKAILKQTEKIQKQTQRYHAAMSKALDNAKQEMDAALAFFYDPVIDETRAALNKAAETLAKEQAELDKIEFRLMQIFANETLADRTELGTYELFQYEAKTAAIKDLEQQIETAQNELFEYQADRSIEHDGAYATAQAVLDTRVQTEREKLISLENQLAALSGERVNERPNKYPFASQALEAQLKQQQIELDKAKKEREELDTKAQADKEAAQAVLLKQQNKALEKAKDAARARIKNLDEQIKEIDKQLKKTKAGKAVRLTEQQELSLAQAVNAWAAKKKAPKDLQADKKSLLQTKRLALVKVKEEQEAILQQRPYESGVQVVRDFATGTYKATPLLSQAEKEAQAEADRLEKEERLRQEQLLRDAEKVARTAERDAQITDLQQEFDAIKGPTDANVLADIMADDNATRAQKVDATIKLDLLTQIRALEAEAAVEREGAPFKIPKPATAPTTAALTRAKPFRTGRAQAKAETEVKQALRIEKKGGVYGAAAAPEFDASLFEDFESRRRYGSDEDLGLFRTTAKAGPSLKEQTVKKIADKVIADWTVVPDIVVVADESGLPEKIRKQATAQGVTGTIPGVYDPSTKTTYLVASNLKDAEDVVLTIAHEVAGHFGLREVLGSAYARTMQRLYAGNKLVRDRADAKMKEQKFLDQNTAVEEVLADMAETGATPQERNIMQRVYDFVKRWLKTKFPSLSIDRVTDNDVRQVVANARRYVLEGDASVLEGGTAATSGLVYRTATYASPEMEAAAKKLDPFVAKQRSVNERVRAASGGFLGLETMLVDRFAGFERLSKYLPEHLGTQMMYYLRMYDMRMNFVAQAVANGAPSLVTKTRKDGKTERLIEAKEGPSIKRTVEILRDANPMVGNAEAVNRLFTAYMAGIRADNKGFDTLNFGEGVTPEMLKDALSVVNGNLALKNIFDNARSEYNAYNRNLIEFLVETGAVSQDVANRLMAENDYIPFYRERGGVAELLIGKEAPIKIGSIKEQPYLQQLVGGDQPILDFLTSSVQNTNFLVDMGMRNLATKNAIYELVDLSAAKIVGGKPSGTNVVKFKDKGVDKYAVLATEKVKIGTKEFETGVPADILVKGMEGVPTQMPVLLRAFAMPAQLLRKGVTLSPLYIARQIFRDSLAAPILAGANFGPTLGALRQIGKPTKDILERRGITGGQQFTGTSDDLSMILRDVADGKPGWMSLLAKAEGLAMSADALTRRAQYNSYVEQGLSEMEATLMSLESMNFSKRGASPSIQIANSMIPFFNAQIQGLNVMYKALTGKMPLNDKLKLREKLLQRGGMMAAASMVYAIMMQDDEAYQNAEADQKYANWFVRIPGVDEPVRIPIPFEIGYIFKALPEAIVNSMASEAGGEQALKALKQIVIQTIPGGSSMPQIGGVPLPLPIPQALKPAIEAGLGKSFYTGRDILSGREKDLLPEDQFRANTAEISKLIGQQAGVSPIILESLVRGYTGTMGLAFLHTLSLGVPPGEGPEKAVKRLSEYPIVGGAFQPNDAGAIINSVYERMNNAQKVGRTYEKMVTEGRAAEANSLLQRRGNEVLQAELGDEFKSNMNQIVAAERAIQASNMSGEEKRKQLDELRKLKIAIAKEIRDIADKTVKLSFSL